MKRIATALFLLSAPALAQSLQMNGRIEKINTVTICPGYQYGVEGTSALVQSSLDLEALVGETFLLRGSEVNDVTCVGQIIEVDSVDPPTATLEACGTARPGCPLRFQVGPPTISFQALFASVGAPGFANLGASGVVTLGNGPIFFLGLSDSPLGIFDLQLPGSAPVGLPLNFQGFHQDVGPIQGPGSFSNPIQVILQPQGPLCVDPTSCFD